MCSKCDIYWFQWSIILLLTSLFDSRAFQTVPCGVGIRQTATVPVYAAAFRANVHLFKSLDLSPAQLAVSNEVFISLFLLFSRQILETHNIEILSNNKIYLFSAAGTARMVPPPKLDALEAKRMSTFQLAIVFLIVTKTDHAFSNWRLSVALQFGHSSSDPWHHFRHTLLAVVTVACNAVLREMVCLWICRVIVRTGKLFFRGSIHKNVYFFGQPIVS